MCFNIVDLNYFPSYYICKGLVCFYISINRYDFVIFYFISSFFSSISFYYGWFYFCIVSLYRLWSWSVFSSSFVLSFCFVLSVQLVYRSCSVVWMNILLSEKHIQAAKAWSHGLFKCKLIGHEENSVSHFEEENYIINMILDDLIIILTIKLTALSFTLFSDPCLVQTWFISKKEFYGFVTIFLVIFSGTKFSHLTS